jgi:hypothetical protein
MQLRQRALRQQSPEQWQGAGQSALRVFVASQINRAACCPEHILHNFPLPCSLARACVRVSVCVRVRCAHAQAWTEADGTTAREGAHAC